LVNRLIYTNFILILINTFAENTKQNTVGNSNETKQKRKKRNQGNHTCPKEDKIYMPSECIYLSNSVTV